MLLGLVDCWKQGIVHLDIKPANIALDQDDVVRLIDFGLAKVSPGLQDQASTGIPAFTWFYAPPEQIARKPQRSWWSSACDVRACGATLYMVLTGAPPMRREAEAADLLTPAGDIDMFHAREMLELLTTTLPTPPSAFLPMLPPEVDKFVMTMLQPAPRDRYRDVTAALKALREVTALIQDTSAEYMPVGWRAIEFPSMSQESGA